MYLPILLSLSEVKYYTGALTHPLCTYACLPSAWQEDLPEALTESLTSRAPLSTVLDALANNSVSHNRATTSTSTNINACYPHGSVSLGASGSVLGVEAAAALEARRLALSEREGALQSALLALQLRLAKLGQLERGAKAALVRSCRAVVAWPGGKASCVQGVCVMQ